MTQFETGKIYKISSVYEALIEIIDQKNNLFTIKFLACSNPNWEITSDEPYNSELYLSYMGDVHEIKKEELPLYISWPSLTKNFTEALIK